VIQILLPVSDYLLNRRRKATSEGNTTDKRQKCIQTLDNDLFSVKDPYREFKRENIELKSSAPDKRKRPVEFKLDSDDSRKREMEEEKPLEYHKSLTDEKLKDLIDASKDRLLTLSSISSGEWTTLTSDALKKRDYTIRVGEDSNRRTAPLNRTRPEKHPKETSPEYLTRLEKHLKETSPEHLTGLEKHPKETSPEHLTRLEKHLKETSPAHLTRLEKHLKETSPEHLTRLEKHPKETSPEHLTRLEKHPKETSPEHLKTNGGEVPESQQLDHEFDEENKLLNFLHDNTVLLIDLKDSEMQDKFIVRRTMINSNKYSSNSSEETEEYIEVISEENETGNQQNGNDHGNLIDKVAEYKKVSKDKESVAKFTEENVEKINKDENLFERKSKSQSTHSSGQNSVEKRYVKFMKSSSSSRSSKHLL
jgi:hypothetical protein